MSGAEQKSDSTPAAPSGGGNKLVMILTIVNVIATLGIIGLLFVSFQKQKTPPQIEDIATESEKKDTAAGAHGEGHGEAPAEHGEKKDDGHGAAPDKKKSTVEYGKMIQLDQFVVNLSTPGSSTPKFIRVKVSLEVPNTDAETEVNAKMPQVRNVIIDLFNSKRPSDLSHPEGRDYLKEEIRNAVNGFMVNGKVKGVFFTNFAVTS